MYKRAIEKNYQLKMAGSRAVFSEISKRFPTMPFTARALQEKRRQLWSRRVLQPRFIAPVPGALRKGWRRRRARQVHVFSSQER